MFCEPPAVQYRQPVYNLSGATDLLTPSPLSSPPPPAGATKDLVTQDDKGPAAWTDSIGNAFLAPYELNADKSSWSANGTKGPIQKALSGLDLKTYYYQGAVDPQTKGNISRWVVTGDYGFSCLLQLHRECKMSWVLDIRELAGNFFDFS